ncbi:hypothetical protein D6774_02945 [Candidatus Woesearchaeota archaeon]|nr:MAG: hypothetical protein D6774_02945 [Candidatus Woesearchaeota archaeon]
MTSLEQIFVLIVVFFIARYVFRDAPTRYANFGAALVVGVILSIPFVIPALSTFLSYAVVIAFMIVMLFGLLVLFGDYHFKQYLQGGETKYWLIIAAVLISAFALSQVVGEQLLEEEVFTGAAVKTPEAAIEGKQFLDAVFIIIVAIAILTTFAVFKF